MNLTRREKQIISIGIILFGLIIAFHIFVRPAISRVRTLRRVLPDKQQVLSELISKSKQYNTISRELEKMRLEIDNQPEERKILSSIERIQKECDLIQKVVYIKPSTTPVNDTYEKTIIEIKFQSITLNQLIQFLLKIESSEFTIGIRTLNIKRGINDSSLLDTIIQLVSLSSTGQL